MWLGKTSTRATANAYARVHGKRGYTLICGVQDLTGTLWHPHGSNRRCQVSPTAPTTVITI